MIGESFLDEDKKVCRELEEFHLGEWHKRLIFLDSLNYPSYDVFFVDCMYEMKSQEAIRRMRRDLWVFSLLADLLSTPFIGEASTYDTPGGTTSVRSSIQLFKLSPPTKMEVWVSFDWIMVNELLALMWLEVKEWLVFFPELDEIQV